MRILLFLSIFLLPLCASAQILRAYGVIEVGSLPTSSTTGPKFAYRPADSSFYRWVSGSTWVKIIPDGPKDTLKGDWKLNGVTVTIKNDKIGNKRITWYSQDVFEYNKEIFFRRGKRWVSDKSILNK